VNPTSVAAGLDPNSVSPGLLGFIIVVIIGIATWFLARSMTKQLRKLDADHTEKPELPEQQTEQDRGSGQGPAPNGAH
jgi:flagellar biosynthesis/type III secretory pathway M-ring protein FliF/YscJ